MEHENELQHFQNIENPSADTGNIPPKTQETDRTAWEQSENAEKTEQKQYGDWYSVSYNGSGYTYASEDYTRKKNRRFSAKIALCAALVAVCMVLSGAVGFCGYLIADSIWGTPLAPGDDPENGGYMPSGSEGVQTEGIVYDNNGAADYAYSNVTVNQIDTTATRNEENGSAGNRGVSLINAIEAVRSSVVEITTTVVSYRGQLVAGAGSGVIIHEDGIIVTNNHVIEGVSAIYVRLVNGNTYQAYLRGTDEENDIAVLKIQPRETLTVAKFAQSNELALGERVFAIGNPLGELGGTVTDGIISALARKVEMSDGTMTLLQTNAAINSGNSGGGLFNMAGELVGIVNAKYSATGVEGLGFAIPANTAVTTVNALLKHGYIPGRASLGVVLSETNVILSGRLTTIPYVYATVAGSPLLQGDYIYKVGDVVVSTEAELNRAVRSYKVGDTVKLTIFRAGNRGNLERSEVEVTLVEYVPADAAMNFGQ